MIRRFERIACIDWSGARGERQGGLPTSEQVSKVLSQEDYALLSDVYKTLGSDNLNAQVEESYKPICSRFR